MIDYRRTTLSTASAGEPVEWSELKDHLRVAQSSDAENTLLTHYIKTAREFAEGYTGRRFVTQTWKYYMDAFPGDNYIEIPYAPLQAASFAIQYTDASSSASSVSASSYAVDTNTTPGRVVLDFGATWPGSTLANNNPIQITFKCGYGLNAASTPMSIRTWIMACAGFMYENREMDVSEFPVGTLNRYRASWA
jgi:uncharacterized phiE125 gp8 family phage protein